MITICDGLLPFSDYSSIVAFYIYLLFFCIVGTNFMAYILISWFDTILMKCYISWINKQTKKWDSLSQGILVKKLCYTVYFTAINHLGFYDGLYTIFYLEIISFHLILCQKCKNCNGKIINLNFKRVNKDIDLLYIVLAQCRATLMAGIFLNSMSFCVHVGPRGHFKIVIVVCIEPHSQ